MDCDVIAGREFIFAYNMDKITDMKKNKRLKDNEFRCDECDGIFELGQSDEDAAQECLENFGRKPQPTDGIVCDDCYNKIMGKIKITNN